MEVLFDLPPKPPLRWASDYCCLEPKRSTGTLEIPEKQKYKSFVMFEAYLFGDEKVSFSHDSCECVVIPGDQEVIEYDTPECIKTRVLRTDPPTIIIIVDDLDGWDFWKTVMYNECPGRLTVSKRGDTTGIIVPDALVTRVTAVSCDKLEIELIDTTHLAYWGTV